MTLNQKPIVQGDDVDFLCIQVRYCNNTYRKEREKLPPCFDYKFEIFPFSLKEHNQKVPFETMLHQYLTLQGQPDTSCCARACSKVSHKSSGYNG